MDRYAEIAHAAPRSIQLGDFGAGFVPLPELGPAHRFIRGNHDDPQICAAHPSWIRDGSIDGDDWREALAIFNQGWSNDAPDLIDAALQKWEPFGPELKQIHAGLDWIKSRLGVTIYDVRPANVGQSAAGVFGQRDLGKSDIGEAMVAAARDMPLTRFDELASSRFACPS